jgi:hypothetical protein
MDKQITPGEQPGEMTKLIEKSGLLVPGASISEADATHLMSKSGLTSQTSARRPTLKT